MEKYLKLIRQNFINTCPLIIKCKKENCGKYLRLELKGEARDKQCPCGYIFCTNCSEDSHAPSTCTQAKEWNQERLKRNDDMLWIWQNTKLCPSPKCSYPIEKNMGCNYMRCIKCNYEFCWLCLDSWKTHGDHFKCHKYDNKSEDDRKKIDTVVENKNKAG